jgi:hypothetical protein
MGVVVRVDAGDDADRVMGVFRKNRCPKKSVAPLISPP